MDMFVKDGSWDSEKADKYKIAAKKQFDKTFLCPACEFKKHLEEDRRREEYYLIHPEKRPRKYSSSSDDHHSNNDDSFMTWWNTIVACL
jgi:hypothetical protein